MTERVQTFGSHRGLVGILSEPSPDALRSDAPAVIFSNVGLNHRVGPNRLYVELARTLAHAGFRSLRFDLSGFGDSEPRRDGGSDVERATRDMREAMDLLAKRGVSRFVLVGLCSGVDSVHRAALEDGRVVGATFIDGYTYRNFGFWLRYFSVRNAQPARWRRYFRVRVARLMGQSLLTDPDDLPDVFERANPTREQFRADLAAFSAQSLKMLFVFTTNEDGSYNYRNQFYDTFGYRNRIDVEFYTRADHVFSSEAQREMLISRMVHWLEAGFPPQAYHAHVATSSKPVALRGSRTAFLVGPAAIFSYSRLLGLVGENSCLFG